MPVVKIRHFLPLAGALILSACDRGPSEAQRLTEERAALEKEKAALAAEKLAAQQTANEQERARLDAERAALQSERARLTGDREAAAAAEREASLAKERADRMAAERKAADEAAARREAEVREREAREAAARSAEQARTAQTVDFFYDALDPYGEWVDVGHYGYAFHPRVARDPRWRPYTDGAWAYTDYGWTWRSNEPFGWATYHYGRWARVPRLGWVWVPGSEWGPAWVSWRRSDEYVGWAPLPPDAWSSRGFDAAVDAYFDIGPGLYAFLRVRDFGEPTYVGRVVAPEQNTTIINQTVNVTKVTYQRVQNNVTIVNQGPDLTVINQRATRPVPRLKVERINAGATQPARVQGDVLQLVAPVLKAERPTKKPAQIRQSVQAAEIEHGWAEAKGDVAKFRAAAQQEARRAEEEQRKPERVIQPPKATTPVPKPIQVPQPVAPPTPARPTPGAPLATAPPAHLPKKAQPPTSPVRRPRAPLAPELPPATPAGLPAREAMPAATPVKPQPESLKRPSAPSQVKEPGASIPATPVPDTTPAAPKSPLKKFRQAAPGSDAPPSAEKAGKGKDRKGSRTEPAPKPES